MFSLWVSQLFGATSKFFLSPGQTSLGFFNCHSVRLSKAFVFSVFTDPSQFFFLKMCHPKMSLVLHMKSACRAWYYPSSSREIASVAPVTYEAHGMGLALHLSDLPLASFSPAHFVQRSMASYCSTDSWAHFFLRTSAVLLPRTLFSQMLTWHSPHLRQPLIQWHLLSETSGHPISQDSLSLSQFYSLSCFPPPNILNISLIYLFSFPTVDRKFSVYRDLCLFCSLLTPCGLECLAWCRWLMSICYTKSRWNDWFLSAWKLHHTGLGRGMWAPGHSQWSHQKNVKCTWRKKK